MIVEKLEEVSTQDAHILSWSECPFHSKNILTLAAFFRFLLLICSGELPATVRCSSTLCSEIVYIHYISGEKDGVFSLARSLVLAVESYLILVNYSI